MENVDHPQSRTLLARVKRYMHIAWFLILYAANKIIDAVLSYWTVIRREAELFIGAALTAIGLLGFNSARFCDGNTADYLSCTRPTAYHYYSGFDIFIATLGIFFILIWFFDRKNK